MLHAFLALRSNDVQGLVARPTSVHGSLPTLRGAPFHAIRPSDLKPRERYKVLTSFVLPRPIAWVTTIGPDRRGQRGAVQFLQRVLRGSAALHVRRQSAARRPHQGYRDQHPRDQRVRGQHDRRGAGAGDAREQRRLSARDRRAGLSRISSWRPRRKSPCRGWRMRRFRWNARPGRKSTSTATGCW